MKKILLLLLTVFVFSACSNNTTTTSIDGAYGYTGVGKHIHSTKEFTLDFNEKSDQDKMKLILSVLFDSENASGVQEVAYPRIYSYAPSHEYEIKQNGDKIQIKTDNHEENTNKNVIDDTIILQYFDDTHYIVLKDGSLYSIGYAKSTQKDIPITFVISVYIPKTSSAFADQNKQYAHEYELAKKESERQEKERKKQSKEEDEKKRLDKEIEIMQKIVEENEKVIEVFSSFLFDLRKIEEIISSVSSLNDLSSSQITEIGNIIKLAKQNNGDNAVLFLFWLEAIAPLAGENPNISSVLTGFLEAEQKITRRISELKDNEIKQYEKIISKLVSDNQESDSKKMITIKSLKKYLMSR